MTEPGSESVERLRGVVAAALHAHWKFFLVQGVAMMTLGLIAVALPQIASLTIEIVIGWLFFVGGLFRTLVVLKARQAPGFWWSLLTAVLALALGLILVTQPLAGVLTLTMVLMVVFLAEGIAAILIAIDFRHHLRNWGWTLFSGLVDFVLAYLIWQGWPTTADWAVGLLVGINMIMFGLSLAMTAIAARLIGHD